MTVLMDVSVWLLGSFVLGLAVGGILRFAGQRQIDEQEAITSWEATHDSCRTSRSEPRLQPVCSGRAIHAVVFGEN
jgi:hypothetical protein